MRVIPSILQPAESAYACEPPLKVIPVIEVLTPDEQKPNAEMDAQVHLANFKGDWSNLQRLIDGRGYKIS